MDYTINLSGGAKNQYTGNRGVVLWMTGLSGSGKTTIAELLWSKVTNTNNMKTIILDGDNIRKGLCSDLQFTLEDRTENIRRISELCKLLSESGVNVITAFISPTDECRRNAADIIGNDWFREVYVKCSLQECIKRDPKGLYKKALNGVIDNFTGVQSAYIPPESPYITLSTEDHTAIECADQVISLMVDNGEFCNCWVI